MRIGFASDQSPCATIFVSEVGVAPSEHTPVQFVRPARISLTTVSASDGSAEEEDFALINESADNRRIQNAEPPSGDAPRQGRVKRPIDLFTPEGEGKSCRRIEPARHHGEAGRRDGSDASDGDVEGSNKHLASSHPIADPGRRRN